jgi:hypothetical protein
MSRFARTVVIDPEQSDLGVEPKEDEVREPTIIKDVPPKSIYGNNLKNISSYNKLRQGYKLNNQKTVFLNDIKAILKEFPHGKHQYDDELLIEILNIAESYFIYGNKEQRELMKQECIFEILLPYFRDDRELLLKTISHVWYKVKKTSLLKRCWGRFKNFFLSK